MDSENTTKTDGGRSYNKEVHKGRRRKIIYILYVDVYLMQNLCMDYIALTGVNYFLRRGKKKRRMLVTAAVSSVGSLCITLVVQDVDLRILLSHFIWNTFMVWLGFGMCTGKAFLENWAATYFSILFLGGVAEMSAQTVPQIPVWISGAACAVVFTMVLCWLNRRREFGSHIYQLLLLHRGKQVECKGYWDSGNQLRDPYAGRPVSIVSAHIAGKLLERDIDPIRYVPYRSLGKKNGLLAVTDLEAMVLRDGKREKKVSPVQIGIADDDLFTDRKYDVLLHASIPVPSEKRKNGKIGKREMS